MNFFGHAAIAGQFHASPEFVLGAMLPDFCGMLGLRTPGPSAGVLGEGVRFHHLTDHAFHELAAFRGFCSEATAWLDAQGVRRGTARAVAHVGVELLLDAALAEGDTARTRYLAALGVAQLPELFERIELPPSERTSLAGLARTLEARGVSRAPDTALVVTRLERALAARPRLRIEPSDLAHVSSWVELFRDRVLSSTPDIVNELVSVLTLKLAA
jgi:hypothetical protein